MIRTFCVVKYIFIVFRVDLILWTYSWFYVKFCIHVFTKRFSFMYQTSVCIAIYVYIIFFLSLLEFNSRFWVTTFSEFYIFICLFLKSNVLTNVLYYTYERIILNLIQYYQKRYRIWFKLEPAKWQWFNLENQPTHWATQNREFVLFVTYSPLHLFVKPLSY